MGQKTMRLRRFISAMLLALCTCFATAGCSNEAQSDFPKYEEIADLATIECTYHNVAEIYNDGTDVLFGINVGYKKAWFEYDGSIELGIDASKVEVSKPDANGVVTISVPNAQVLGDPQVDESTFSDIYSETGLLTHITTVDQSQTFQAAQQEMRQSAESDEKLLTEAKNRAKTLLEEYVINVGKATGKTYTVKFVDME
jgi:hypothetical protein